MTLSDSLLTHLKYHRWATGLVLEDAIGLTAEQLVTPLKSSFSSANDTLVHLYQSDAVWLGRLEERPAGKLEDYEAPGCMWELRDAWTAVQDRMIAFAGQQTDESINRKLSYKNLAGQSFETPIWQILLHVVNHGSHHRGQLVTMFRQLGAKPQNIDLIRYYRSELA